MAGPALGLLPKKRITRGSSARAANLPTKPEPKESSLDRLLAVIDLFSLIKPVWTGEEIGTALGLSRATLYRYLRSLGASGLIAPTGGGKYVLGPRIIELDRQIRLSDPMLKHAAPVMQEMVKHYEGVALLCTYYRDKVMSIHHEASDPSIQFIMQRGRPFPLFRGSPSKAILAHLPPHQLKSFVLHEGPKIRDAGLGETWPEFRDALKEIRTEGVIFAYGELDRELVGISAPIFRGDGDVAGSITVVQTKRKFQRDTLLELKEVAKTAGMAITKELRWD